MTLSLRDDIATFTDQQKGFEAKNKLVKPEDFAEGYNNDFSSPSSDAEMDAARKARAAEKAGIKNYKLFTEQEVKKIYDAVDEVHPFDETKSTLLRDDGRPSQEQLKKFRNVRLKSQIMMAYTMGLRASELAEMDKPEYAFKWKNINLEGGTAKVTGKGGKTRKIIIPPSALLHMREWHKIASQVDPNFANSQFVFPSFDRFGAVDIDKPMSGDVFSGDLKKLAGASGINPKRLRPHVFRHSYATHMYMHGVGLEAISKQLGHARLDTTEIYRHLTDEFLELQVRPVIEGLDPSGRTTTAAAAPKGVMGEGSSKAFNQFVNGLDPAQRADLQDIMHTYRDGVGDQNKGRVYLMSQLEKFGPENAAVLDQEAMRLRRGQVPGGLGGGPSATQQAREGVHRALGDSPLNNDMDAKIAEDRLKASIPQLFGERDSLVRGQFGKNFNVNVTSEGAQKVLDIAKAENISIADAHDRLVTSIETTHYKLGDPKARENFRNYVNGLFPQGIGRPGEKVLFDPPGMPKGIIADAFDHHVIAQYLFDEGKLVDGDPVKTTEGRRARLYEYAQSVGAVNNDGTIKRSGDPSLSSFVGNQIAAMEARGGEYRWSSFDIDKDTGQRVFIPLVGPDVKVYPYLSPELNGYKVSDAEAKVKPGVLPAWARQKPSAEQAKFFADMREYDTLNDATKRMGGNPNLAADLGAARERIGEIKGEYKFVGGAPTIFPEFVPGLVDAPKTILALSSSFDPNIDKNIELAERAASKQATTPDYNKMPKVPQGALVAPKLSFRETAQKSALGDALDKISKGTAKLLPFAILGYGGYEIYGGKPAWAVVGEAVTPMVLDSGPAQAPGIFAREKQRQELTRKKQEREMESLRSADEEAFQAMRDNRIEPSVEPLARLGSNIVEGITSFFTTEDEPEQVDVAGSPNMGRFIPAKENDNSFINQ